MLSQIRPSYGTPFTQREIEQALYKIYKGEIATADATKLRGLSLRRSIDFVGGGREGEGMLVLLDEWYQLLLCTYFLCF